MSARLLYMWLRTFVVYLFNILVIRRDHRAITYAVITIVISMFTIFKCANSSRDWYKDMSINFLIDNSMSVSDATARFDREVESFMQRWELTGASFALMRNDSLLYAKGYGYADVEKKELCDVRHVFRVASVSKLITATAVMKLVEGGGLSLTSKLFGEEGILCDEEFLEYDDKNLERITVEHLLRHTGGFSTPIDDPAFANYSVARSLGKELPLALDDMVAYALRNRLRYQPGSHYEYSNLGYMLLTKVVEKVSGMGYESYVQEAILSPAGCFDMYIGSNYSRDRDRNEVRYYEVKEAEKVDAHDGSGRLVMKSDGGNNVTLLGGAGGWVASPVELLRLVASINKCGVKSEVLSGESIATMTYDSSDRCKKPIGWATVNGQEWQRSGSMAGTTAFVKQQRDGYTWVFVTNSSAWIGYKLTNYISSQITKSIGNVKQWPTQDLFTIGE
ncbi:MAG: serine hydrolase domain-containing protein [Rikenellaceae bacterium]